MAPHSHLLKLGRSWAPGEQLGDNSEVKGALIRDDDHVVVQIHNAVPPDVTRQHAGAGASGAARMHRRQVFQDQVGVLA